MVTWQLHVLKFIERMSKSIFFFQLFSGLAKRKNWYITMQMLLKAPKQWKHSVGPYHYHSVNVYRNNKRCLLVYIKKYTIYSVVMSLDSFSNFSLWKIVLYKQCFTYHKVTSLAKKPLISTRIFHSQNYPSCYLIEETHLRGYKGIKTLWLGTKIVKRKKENLRCCFSWVLWSR